jgi:hypothetical protein
LTSISSRKKKWGSTHSDLLDFLIKDPRDAFDVYNEGALSIKVSFPMKKQTQENERERETDGNVVEVLIQIL